MNCSCNASVPLLVDADSLSGSASATLQDPVMVDREAMEGYDYNGAILFVVGLLLMYGLGMFLLIVSIIHKARSELEIIDHLRDLEEMRKVARKKRRSGRFSLRSQPPDSPEPSAQSALMTSSMEEGQSNDSNTGDGPAHEIFV